MTDDEWAAITAVLEDWWKSDWQPRKASTYALALQTEPFEVVSAALRKLAENGSPWMPTVPEILAAIRHDPALPTWTELEGWLWHTPGRRRGPIGEHPAVKAWIASQGGLERLNQVPVHCPNEGPWRRKELAQSWADHTRVTDEREQHAIATGQRAGDLRQLTPIAALALPTPGRAEITA